MLTELLHRVPVDIVNFILVTLFSLLIGLEQRRHHIKAEFETLFGTDRTFTLIGILGYILYVIEPNSLMLFAGGGLAIIVLLAVYYQAKIKTDKKFGITSLIIALITYCLAPLIYTQPAWLVLLIVVSVLLITEMKDTLFEFSKKFDDNEFVTLAKFLVIAGVILPLLPDKAISAEINISPYKFWLAIVAVSGISYFSYLIKRFVFPNAGIILTGILGGLYSSTATTFILARKSKEMPDEAKVTSAVILATSMMFLRVFLLALFFNKTIAYKLAPSFALFIVVSVLIALYFMKSPKLVNRQGKELKISNFQSNPLEFKTAFVFGVLFIFFAIITEYVTKNFGEGGIKKLSFIVGVTDIDPFIINLFQGKRNIEISTLVTAVLIAITSNNLLKMIYGIMLCNKKIRWQLITGFGILIMLGLMVVYVFPLW
ncbi:MAG: DUF4010 domain-containing protein [Chlorobi bacterium]|nr:DUF4010 domain-containing protein [Chlorobiota bacterium]